MTYPKITFNDYDEFKRKEVASKLINLLKSEIDVSPIVIDGDWGAGKTEFTYKLINLFEEEDFELDNILKDTEEQSKKSILNNHKLIYIDAYKADHADEPLMTILAALINAYPDIKEKTEFRKKAMTALKFGTKTVLKGGMNWVLRQDSVAIVNDFDEEIKAGLNQPIDNILSIHEKSEENIKALIKVLEKITEKHPTIIFIDELDRCRPNFAIKMLENIKHIFDINNLQFVLVANLNQIRSSIKHCYGDSVNSKSYLDKFLGFTFGLPQTIPMSNQIDVSCSHYKRLLRGSEYLKSSKLIQDGYIEFIEKIITINQLTLRQVETLIRYLNIYQIISNNNLTKNESFGITLLKILGIYIFCFEPETVADINHGIVDAVKLNKIMGKEILVKINNQNKEMYCEHIDKISFVIHKESNKNKSKFGRLEDGDEELWTKSIGSMFNSWETSLTPVDIIKLVINNLQLG